MSNAAQLEIVCEREMAIYNFLICGGTLFFLIICNFNPRIAYAFDESELYSLYPELLLNHEAPISFVSLRQKRETQTYYGKNQPTFDDCGAAELSAVTEEKNVGEKRIDKKLDITVNPTNDYHEYYNSSMYVDKAEADRVWNLVKNISYYSKLSQSHRQAMTVELSFKFPFYGHPIQNVTVATGGFIYTGDYVHSRIAATQYIAPLMANFDTSLSNEPSVRIHDNGTALIVVWEKVVLGQQQSAGKFTFSAILHNTGDIVFIYYSVPNSIEDIDDEQHPVKVGLSDAYMIDKTIYYRRRKTIYEYHRIKLDKNNIVDGTIVYLKALPTCLDYKDCSACGNHKTSFECAWCPALNRCSTGTDRKKQAWETAGCDRLKIANTSECPPLDSTGNDANAFETITTDAPIAGNTMKIRGEITAEHNHG